MRALRRKDRISNVPIHGSSARILVFFGLQERVRWSIWLCERLHLGGTEAGAYAEPTGFFMLVLGYFSLLIQILIYVWATESPFICASVVVMVVLILAPFLSFS